MILPFGYEPLNPEKNEESSIRDLWAKHKGNFFLQKSLEAFDHYDETPQSFYRIHYILVGSEHIAGVDDLYEALLWRGGQYYDGSLVEHRHSETN